MIPPELQPHWSTIQRLAAEHGVPAARIGGTVMIESNGDPRAIQKNTANGISYGLMQVVPFGVNWKGHHELVRTVARLGANATRQQVIDALYDPTINLEVGTRSMRSLFAQHQSWDMASSAFFLGNPDWRGQDTVNGNTGVWYRDTLNDWIEKIEGGVMPDDPWRPYPFPPLRDVLVKKPSEGAGFDRVTFRGPRIVGSCNHITDGVPAGDQCVWYRDFFSTGGERAWDALTDTVIATNGDIGVLNDWRDPNRGGTRAGWANGTSNGLEGDGVAFYRNYPEINDVLVSKEHVTVQGRKLTTSQLDASIEFSTAIAQSVKCPWDTYPYHPGKKGVNIEMMHFLFAPKSCPAEPFISTHYPVLVREVRARLKAWQGSEPIPAPDPDPVFTKYGMTTEQLSWFFGVMTRVNLDGTTEELPYDPNGPLSLLWRKRCEDEGIFPEAEQIRAWDSKLAEGREWYATWEGGWTAYLPIDNQRAGWKWLEGAAA